MRRILVRRQARPHQRRCRPAAVRTPQPGAGLPADAGPLGKLPPQVRSGLYSMHVSAPCQLACSGWANPRGFRRNGCLNPKRQGTTRTTSRRNCHANQRTGRPPATLRRLSCFAINSCGRGARCQVTLPVVTVVGAPDRAATRPHRPGVITCRFAICYEHDAENHRLVESRIRQREGQHLGTRHQGTGGRGEQTSQRRRVLFWGQPAGADIASGKTLMDDVRSRVNVSGRHGGWPVEGGPAAVWGRGRSGHGCGPGRPGFGLTWASFRL